MQRSSFLTVSTPHRPLPQSLSRKWQGSHCKQAGLGFLIRSGPAEWVEKISQFTWYIGHHEGVTKINAENGGVNWEPLVKLSPATNQLCNPG